MCFPFVWLINWFWHSSNQLQFHITLVFLVKRHYNLFTFMINFPVEWWKLKKYKLLCPLVRLVFLMRPCYFNCLSVIPWVLYKCFSLQFFWCLHWSDFLPSKLQRVSFNNICGAYMLPSPVTNSQPSYLMLLQQLISYLSLNTFFFF